MNGYTNPSAVFANYNGHSSRSPERQHKAKPKSSAKAIYGTDRMYFLRSSAKKKKEQRKHYTKTSINSLTDTSQYHVEHLTTFVLDRKDGMITIEDGIRKLRLLDAKGKVWTQDMLLQVEDKSVSLHDQETKNELENFPIGTVQHCQAVMNACSYDSILALVCKEPGQSKADLHLFQCEDIKANLIHADIESAMVDAKGGKMKRRPEALKMILKSDGVIPPPPANPAPEPPPTLSQVDVKGRVAAWSAWANEQQDSDNEQRPYLEEGVCPEMSAARVDRDVQILNHILDDIEFFVTKLQKAAEAYNELSKRKKSKKGKKKSPGEGVLTLRSKPPGEEEFVDCLQKFKHAFNLLGKLRDHIQNPSALDLVHFLFTPLRMVIQTSSVELARSVVVPLLSRETVDFLQACLTAEERHVWVTLGDGWTKCRLEWPPDQYFPPCALRFRDGWEPPVLAYLGPSREHELSQIAETIAHAEVQRRDEPPAPQSLPSPADGYVFSQNHSSMLDQDLFTNTSYKQNHSSMLDQDLFTNTSYKQSHSSMLDQDLAVAAFKHAVSRHVDARGQPITFAKSKYDFVARNNTELSVLKDELVEVVDDRKQWWKVRNGAGASGYVPNNILEITKTSTGNAGPEPVYSHTIQLMMPKKEFELFKQLLGELNGVKETHKHSMRTDPAPTAPRPHPHPAPATPPAPSMPPVPPSPPVPPPQAAQLPPAPRSSTVTMREHSATQRTHPPVNRRKSNMEEVQDELMHRLTLGRSAQKKFQVPGPPGRGQTSVNVTYDSSPDEVRAWLEAKGFSSVTITSLGVLTGAQLFSLNKEELKTVCPDDGARVFSQVTVQKAALEKSSGNELQEIMRRRQEKLAASAFDSGVESFDEGSTH